MNAKSRPSRKAKGSLKLDSVVVQWSINKRPNTWDPSVFAFAYLERSPGSRTPDWLGFTQYRHSAYSDGSLAAQMFVDDPGSGVYTSGIAVILFAVGRVREDTAFGDASWEGSIQSFWIAIRDVGGGRYCREGLITCSAPMNESAAMRMARGEVEAPSHLGTIVLS